MAQAKKGDTVKVHYIGTLEDGTRFDASEGREPLQFTLGEGQMIPDFEAAVIGMEPGEKKTIQIPSDRAYGPHQQEMVMEVPRAELPDNLNPQVDQMLQVHPPQGNPFFVRVINVSETSVTMDGNHPLAGKDLTFDIQLAAIA